VCAVDVYEIYELSLSICFAFIWVAGEGEREREFGRWALKKGNRTRGGDGLYEVDFQVVYPSNTLTGCATTRHDTSRHVITSRQDYLVPCFVQSHVLSQRRSLLGVEEEV